MNNKALIYLKIETRTLMLNLSIHKIIIFRTTNIKTKINHITINTDFKSNSYFFGVVSSICLN